MNKRIINVCLIFIAFLTSCHENDNTVVEENYGYENWPGKDGTVKSNIEFPAQLVLQYGLELTVGSTVASFFYKVPLADNDDLKKGRLQIEVYDSVEKSQQGLVEYLDLLTTPSKPPRLSDKNEIFGDVAFGEIYSGVFKLAFVRNNVLVVINAPTETAKAIATGIDEKIKIAPQWQAGSEIPSFILP